MDNYGASIACVGKKKLLAKSTWSGILPSIILKIPDSAAL